MGYGFGAAMGAYFGTGERPVLITGDGSFGMNLTELAAAVSEHANITVIIMNNGVLGMVRQWQTLFFDRRYAGTTLNRQTDFVNQLDDGFVRSDISQSVLYAFVIFQMKYQCQQE